MASNKKTKDENDKCKRFLAQQAMFLSADERVEDAFRAGYRAGRDFEQVQTKRILAKLVQS